MLLSLSLGLYSIGETITKFSQCNYFNSGQSSYSLTTETEVLSFITLHRTSLKEVKIKLDKRKTKGKE